MRFDERVLNGMSVLDAIVRAGSFAGAAKALQMSQPGVSRSIARMEERLGVRLVERTTRALRLTDEGKRLYAQIAPLLSGLEEAAASASEGKVAVRGTLRVNVHPFFSTLVLGPHLKAFLEAYPQLKLELITRDELGDVVGEGFDVAIRFGAPRPSTLVARKLMDMSILTVAAPSYLKRYGHPEIPEDLENGKHVFIDFRDPETGRPFQWEFHRGRKIIKVATNGQLTVSDVFTMHHVCLAGYGIAQVLKLGVENQLSDGRLVQLFPDWCDERFPLYALYPSRRHLPAKTRLFLEFVTSLVQRGSERAARLSTGGSIGTVKMHSMGWTRDS